MSINRRIVSLRESKQLTQKELSIALNINTSVMNRIESGERPLRDDEITKIADFFGVTTDYLLGREPNEDKKNSLPPLNQKDEKDISVALDKILNNLECEEALSFYGEPMDEHTKELIKLSLENSMKMAKQMAKKKFTPKKYR